MFSIETCIRVDGIQTAFRVTREADFNFPGESHFFWELVYVLDGTVGIMAGSHIYELRSGHIAFHKPYEFHRIWSSGNTKPTYLIVSFAMSGSRVHDFENKIFSASENTKVLLNDLVTQITTNGTQGNSLCHIGENELAISRFTFTLSLILIDCLTYISTDKAVENEETLLFRKAVRFMKENMNLTLSNAEFAQYCHTSVSTLKRIFKKYSGVGVHSYFMELKIMKAQSMLKDGNSVKSISNALGFSNQNTLSATFKKKTGLCPTEAAKL